MKLTIIGGGSVRTPGLIPSLARRAATLGLQEVWLMDNAPEKLRLIGGLSESLARQHGAAFRLVLTTDEREAVRGAQHVITSIRPGLERGRALDERIAFQHGVLGQETTGAGGFAMAIRSLPAILHYARLVAEIGAPDAWIYNFTNPAGLVAQGLHDAGIERVLGICDSANGAQHAVSRYLGISPKRVFHQVYGLNHLSWTRSVQIDAENGVGEEVMPGLLEDERFINATHMGSFAPGLRRWQRAFLNEYLHYYYHRDEALAALLNKPETRGEEVLRLTTDLLRQLESAETPESALDIWRSVMERRSASYMAHTHAGNERVELPPIAEDEEGYAGVALGCIEAIATDAPHYTGLNVPNRGSIDGMADDDVVEVGCWVDGAGVRPVKIGSIPEDQYLLMRAVKQYERLAAQAILRRSKELAYYALAVHPLIGSYPLAEKLVEAFLAAHRDLVGEWH